MIPIYWLIAFVALIGIEIATMALTTIWFAGGAVVHFCWLCLIPAQSFSWQHLWLLHSCFCFSQGRLRQSMSTAIP